ncbi:MAG: ATP-binding protein, partial [Pseudomonadota bacterium]
DLHDDVGARLVSIMHARESDEQSRMAQSALSSLRETVSSGNFQDEKLFDLLTDASHNIEARCHNSDLSYTAPQLEGVPDIIISGNRCYHLKRILQEVVSNIIKHAGATEVSMHVSHADDVLVLALLDDGRGLSAADIAGNGMTNIRFRAKEIGGEARWHSGPTSQGCRFELRLSLVPEQTA